MSSIVSELNNLLQKSRDENQSHLSLDLEYSLYRRVQSGEFTKLSQVPALNFKAGMGRLSTNPFRNEIYHGIVMITMVTRFCVEGGLDTERAYTLSDLFINKLDRAKSIIEVNNIKQEALLSFSLEMNKLVTKSDYSIHITKAKEYIEAHIAEPINNHTVASHVGVHEYYLSNLFKKEMNTTLAHYISHRKCEVAKYMLAEGTTSCTDIANFLYFSSSSHFITVFKKYVGCTPNQYRKLHYRKLERM